MQFDRSNNGSPERGFTFVELAMGMVVLVIGAIVLINHLSTSYTTTRMQKDRVFAFNKAQAILSEIQSFVDRGAISAAIELDELDDGTTNKPTLTITEQTPGNLVLPNHPLSENFQRNSDWVWSRRITVQPFQGLNNRDVRYVTVRIYKRTQTGVDRVVASLSSVVSSAGSAFPTTQVFDVYLLAVENIPGWWVFMEAVVPFVESAITDLENRNPGLELRTHWITKSSYGRNQVYRPFINDAVDSTQPVNRAYFYPGRMPAGSASRYYYVPDMIKARMNVDGTVRGGYDATTNPYPYALADFYNHAMRYPREKAWHEKRVAEVRLKKAEILANKAASLPPPTLLDDMSEEPTLRLFYEDLCSNPDKYRSALIINLHGELIPFPSMRNYSDAAKSPVPGLAGMRVVTHPEELRTRRDPGGAGIDDVMLRVYAYTNRPQAYTGPPIMPATNPIVVQVMGVDLTDGSGGLGPDVEISHIEGGITTADDYNLIAPSPTTTSVLGEMAYKVAFQQPPGEEAYTLFLLFNTPVVTEPFASGGGNQGLLRNERARLYGLDYVPSCTTGPFSGVTFDNNLTTTGTGPKNTARWMIKVPGSVFPNKKFVDLDGNYFDPDADTVLTVKTRIYNSSLGTSALETGTMWPTPIEPDNLSETYTWWADSALDVPITERSQFQGDPRHNPYKDLWTGDPDFADGYNRFHDSLNNTNTAYTDYPGINGSLLANRWQNQPRQDVPRFFELLRTGLVNANSIYTTLTGWSYYYMGHGNEIGYDSANGYPSSIPVNVGPWSSGGSTSGSTFVNNITGSRSYVRDATSGTGYWWGIPWLGELYPDHVYVQWIVDGNLMTTGVAADRFYRNRDETTYTGSNHRAYGTNLYTAQQRTQSKGCTSFFNVENAGPGRFSHFSIDGTGNLVGSGLELGQNYNYPIPSLAPINRPWSLLTAAGTAEEFGSPPYSTNRYSASLLQEYYDHPSGHVGSGLVELVNPTNTDAAYIVVNGISNAVSSGSSFIAKYSLLTMVHSFLEGGSPSLTHRLKMPARIEIESPTEITELIDPTAIPIQFDVFWVRWDGKPYTGSMSPMFSENENELEYALMYSRDNGLTWLHTVDESPATPGEKPANVLHIIPDSGPGPETVSWATPAATFPEGSYLVRAEAYRANQSLHYSQHQVRIYITR